MNGNRDAALWPAPAKLNLMLHVTGRRDDGYHELQTVFQFIDLCDDLVFRQREDGQILRAAGDARVSPEDDLVVRSARRLQQLSGSASGAEISVLKRIPMGAGLGGGSSDAATTLHALNRIWQLGLTVDALAEIGLGLGADVPVFVRGYAAFAEGIGECLRPIEPETHWYLLITPDVHVSTREIFSDRELTRDCPAIKICDLSTHGLHALSGPGWDNVLQPVVTGRYPDVAAALEYLQRVLPAGSAARMSGSGATVFAAFENRKDGEQAMKRLQAYGLPEKWRVSINRGHNVSPLFVFMQEHFGPGQAAQPAD